jgi:hypothetical protein
MKSFNTYLLSCGLAMLSTFATFAQNPLIRNQFSADPSARVFGDSVYVYPSHDILATEGHGRLGWFCMEDYHVFSSANMADWTDHGVIVTQNKVPWVKPDSYSMWAPDCIFRNGKYYFYFPTTAKDTSYGRGFAIGVAVADKPYGPFVSQPQPIRNVHGIDPNVFIDKDGQGYLYYAQGNLYVAKLKDNMVELASEPKIIQNLPDKGLKEGPFLFERNGIYYLTYPHVAGKTEQLEYATSNSPIGPFKVAGVIMNESGECWTNHQSIAKFKGQWFLFYHSNDLSPKFDKARSIRADSLFFNADGSIQKVVPTFRGIGLTETSRPIQLDRYSQKSQEGTKVDFIDTANRFAGWKTMLDRNGAWIQYNSVDFGKKSYKGATARVMSETGGTIQIRDKSFAGPVLAEIKVPKGRGWTEIKAPLTKLAPGIHNISAVMKDAGNVEIDWISFQ